MQGRLSTTLHMPHHVRRTTIYFAYERKWRTSPRESTLFARPRNRQPRSESLSNGFLLLPAQRPPPRENLSFCTKCHRSRSRLGSCGTLALGYPCLYFWYRRGRTRRPLDCLLVAGFGWACRSGHLFSTYRKDTRNRLRRVRPSIGQRNPRLRQRREQHWRRHGQSPHLTANAVRANWQRRDRHSRELG